MTIQKKAPQGKVKATGRTGEIVVHDPDDADLCFKLKFDDGEAPEIDWFGRDTVEILGDAILTATSDKKADGAKGVEELPKWAASRPAGTPVEDEGFICAGTKAPVCPPQARELPKWTPPVGTPEHDEGFICAGTKAPICPGPNQDEDLIDGGIAPRCPAPSAIRSSGPITLDVMQGEWVGSSGVNIAISGTDVIMNSMNLAKHKVTLNDDGTVRSIGTLWQLHKWSEDGSGSIDFRASSTQENMECARLEVWTRKAKAVGSAWDEKMKLMGYAGSSADIFNRGIEGCMPGTLGAELPPGSALAKDKEDVALLCALISQWREPKTALVRSRNVIPDFTNRAQTGLGVELLHFVASSMVTKGFHKRVGKQGHDIPVVVREPPGTESHEKARTEWMKKVEVEDGFPPVRVRKNQELFASLGNGHFFQSLNLVDCGCENINDPTMVYKIGDDQGLRDAIEKGVPSIVLRNECPRPVRAKIAALLNSKREFQWTLDENGQVDVTQSAENMDYCSQFEWLSKGMDGVQVDCLVRTHLGIRDSKRIKG